MGLYANMLIDDQQVKEYFRDMESLARCLAQLHPQHFTSAQDVIDKLKAVSAALSNKQRVLTNTGHVISYQMSGTVTSPTLSLSSICYRVVSAAFFNSGK